MATIDQYYRAEYKFCAMNGAPLNITRRGSLDYDLESMTFTVEQFVQNEDGNFLLFDFAGAFTNEPNSEPLTEKVTRPIIALPHEIKDLLK
ncbi:MULTISPECIES: hypothetical protein [Actinomycetes]|uniref:hypothetical protein n=1 Tax=Actinomycetes TaxID=1760 RepID=UPI0034185618